ncbi:MAG: hypothetical protein H5T95_08365 [Firmicutes bacterium]|nr:hypothetical protein [Bacillota bacterium]
MVRRRTVFAIVVGLFLLGFAAAPAFGDSLTVYRLEPSSGWVELPPVNPYATAVGENPLQGWSSAGSVSWPMRATATFEPDVEKAELTVDFVPVSRGIRPNEAKLFIAPLGRRLEWKVVITVRNPNDIVMRNVKVRDEFGPAFRVTLAGRPHGDAHIEGDAAKGGLPLNPALVWDIGDLAPGEAARAELTMVTGRDGHGNQQFSREGIYSIDTGARLTYVLADKSQVRNAPSGSVIARKDADALRGDGAPFDVAPGAIAGEGSAGGPSVVPVKPPVTGASLQVGGASIIRDNGGVSGGIGARDIGRTDPRFTITAMGKTANVAEDGGQFVVPTGEYAEWEVSVSISCPDLLLTGWQMTLDFGPELWAEEIPGSRDIVAVPDRGAGPAPGIARDPSTGKVKVIWNRSGVGVSAASGQFKLKVCTAEPTGYEDPGTFTFCDNMTLSYQAVFGSGTVTLSPPISIKAEGAYANVSLSATRLDWRVRKAGTYAALATEMSFTGSGNLSIQFDGFADLARLDGGAATISTWYGFGQDLAAVESSGWIAAGDLNLRAGDRGPLTLDPTTPTTLKMWSKIAVGEEDSSCEYEGVGVITFIVSNN